MVDATRGEVCRAVGAACVLVGLLAPAAPAAAQSEDALKSSFEGKRVTIKIDMPGTSDGIDVNVDAPHAIDGRRYGDRLKEYGVALHAGESAAVTLIKVKKDLIEFQLAGGGFGTFTDDTSTSVYIPHVEKSSREKDLERKIKDENDSYRRRQMERELDDLRDRRERENRRIDAERARAEERKRERIAEERLRGGSRFNVRYADAVPAGMRPEELMAALAEYVDFSNGGPAEYVDTRPAVDAAAPKPAADGVLPRKGMTRADAERAFGKPVIDAVDRREGSVVITTLVFVSGDQKITADFVEDVLVRYTMTSR